MISIYVNVRHGREGIGRGGGARIVWSSHVVVVGLRITIVIIFPYTLVAVVVEQDLRRS